MFASEIVLMCILCLMSCLLYKTESYLQGTAANQHNGNYIIY